MAKIILDASELKNQAAEMTALGAEYEHLFSNVNGILSNVNNNWSANLAHNFSGKISSAQKSFSAVTEMLKFGADAADTSAESFGSVDENLRGVMKRFATQRGHIGSSGTSHGGGGVGSYSTKKGHIGSSDTTHRGGGVKFDSIHKTTDLSSVMGTSAKTAFSPTVSWGYGDDIAETAEDNYHKIIDGEKVTDKGYTISNYGSTTGRKKIIGDIYYEKRRDVKEYYGYYDKGNNYEIASGEISSSAEEIVIGQGSEEQIHIKINHMTGNAEANYDPDKGSAYISAGLEYDVASVGFEIGDSVDGLGAAEANIKLGLGGGIEAGVHNGIIKVDASLALGLGVDVSFEINYKNWKDAFVDAFTFD